MGAIIPDYLEGKGFLSLNHDARQSWKKYHRTYTHWFIPYLIVFLLSVLILKENPATIHPLKDSSLFSCLPTERPMFWLLSALSVGAILHIIQDAVSGKVPLLNPKIKSFGIRLIPVRSFFEFIVTTVVSAGFLLWVIK